MNFVARLATYRKAADIYEWCKQEFAKDMPGLFLGARTHVGLTQRQLAERLGVSHTYISKIEHGEMMPGDELLERFRQIIEQEEP